jgi:hypothetical protein
MARSLGVSHTTIWRTVEGKRPPGRELLAALSSHPKINPTWLLNGVGEPLLAEREDAPGGGWPVPIAREPLPGSPSDHPTFLTQQSFPVAGAYYRPTRYFLEVAANELVVRVAQERVAPGDLILMETHEAAWQQPKDIDGRLCVVLREHPGSVAGLQLGRVAYYAEQPDEPAMLMADFFEGNTRSELSKTFIIEEHPDGRLEVRRGRPRGPGGTPLSQVSLGAQPVEIDLSDIIAVEVLLVRR